MDGWMDGWTISIISSKLQLFQKNFENTNLKFIKNKMVKCVVINELGINFIFTIALFLGKSFTIALFPVQNYFIISSMFLTTIFPACQTSVPHPTSIAVYIKS
jgi:hypothetical protein